jgi:hypothetical protein
MNVRYKPAREGGFAMSMVIRAGERNALAVARLPNKPPAKINSKEADRNSLLISLQKS